MSIEPLNTVAGASRPARHKDIEERDPPPERIASAGERQLPDFIIIGAQRGGTTSLYRYLVEHPDIGPAYCKEVHYFDRYFDRGPNWYLAHFPIRGEYKIAGEASPYYLFHPEVPERLREYVPNAKLIALLRNPIDRAYSQYQMNSRKGNESLSFEEAVEREPERLAGTDDPLDPSWRHHSYLARGLYAEQLRRWFEIFPRDQIMVIQSERFYGNPERTLHEVQAAIGLPPHTPGRFKAFHQSEYPQMDDALLERLRAHFAPHNRDLYDLLGVDFGWDHA
ncbi:MAG: sulfotransferase [Thermomicrobiales bacterium]